MLLKSIHTIKHIYYRFNIIELSSNVSLDEQLIYIIDIKFRLNQFGRIHGIIIHIIMHNVIKDCYIPTGLLLSSIDLSNFLSINKAVKEAIY